MLSELIFAKPNIRCKIVGCNPTHLSDHRKNIGSFFKFINPITQRTLTFLFFSNLELKAKSANLETDHKYSSTI